MSVPLSHYSTHPGCGVPVFWNGCHLQRDFDLEVVISRLNRRGLNGEEIGIANTADSQSRMSTLRRPALLLAAGMVSAR